MQLSKEKKDRIIEQILLYLYQIFPKYPFTSEIAKEIARDEEFIKKLLFEMKSKNLLLDIKQDSQGNIFSRRIKWKLTNKIYDLIHHNNHNKYSNS